MTGVYRQVYLSLLSMMGSRVTMGQGHARNMGQLPRARLYCTKTKKITSMAASQARNRSRRALSRALKTHSQLNYDVTSVGVFTQGLGSRCKIKHKKPFKCRVKDCSWAFRYSKDLDRHCKEQHSDGAGYFCPFAGCKYSQEKGVGIKRKSNWQRHVQTQHRS
ncbi:uncharacterized protein BDZ83DRAFT_18913 [Colletotrichum acutatum]|uniref:C2H2-type domain-containing protein n=1 Tax=Glomerella acutata TaxID=27357 RepID=A0AAD8XCF2_GLOAC|nr:uncharacterized protein BDZ83DRAFT_18913 [Colletotrichum acutatum]KAK1718726.1 hypothetical protein BDZ83DRAFT_18913 [Colletotrichum acutatum]